MNELFDTTHLRQAAAIQRHLADAQATGQGDLFDAPAETGPAETGPAETGPAETKLATVTAYVATSDRGGSNVYLMGSNCRDCDRTYDPMFRHGVPCVNANWHAEHSVASWRFHGVTSAHVVAVEIPDTGDRAEMAAAARRAAAERTFTWPTPVGAFYGRDDLAGEMMLR